MSEPIWYDSTETGAPVLNNAAGSLIALLRACLINGFNVKAITGITVSSGVATVTCPAHGYSNAYGKWLKISGANVPALNGTKQQTIVDANTFSYPAPGVANGTYTATDARRAPADWVELFQGTNKSVFQRSDPEATAMLLRVDDTGSAPATVTDARCVMVESATDVDTFVDPSPTVAQASGGGYIYKGANNATAKKWAIVADGRFLWLMHPSVTNVTPYDMQISHFGDGVPFRTPDPYFCLLSASLSSGGNASSAGAGLNTSYGVPSTYQGGVVARNFAASSKSVITHKCGAGAGAVLGAEGVGQFGADVVAISRTYHQVEPDLIFAGGHIRGEVPGLAGPLARLPFANNGQFAVVTPDVGDGRSYLSVLYSGTSARGNALIDLTGPWY